MTGAHPFTQRPGHFAADGPPGEQLQEHQVRQDDRTFVQDKPPRPQPRCSYRM
jgi:hypothetical protein